MSAPYFAFWGFLLLAASALPSALATVYRVGPNRPYKQLSALPILKPGDRVEFDPGTYHEFRKWRESGTPGQPITLRGVGKTRPVFDGTGLNVSGAGKVPRTLFQIEGSHYVLENLEFRNASNGQNGAGIRVTGATDTTIRRCRIHQCEMGIMSNDNDRLLIERCEIDHNGNPVNFNGYAHNLYLEGDRTTVRDCWIHDAIAGMNFKTRGHYTELLYNWIADSNEGELSLVDSEKTKAVGSHVVLIGNVIVSKPDRTGNTGKFIDWGQDMGGERHGTLFMFNNTLVAGSSRIAFLSLSAPDADVQAANNVFYGSDQIVSSQRGRLSGFHNWLPESASVPNTFTNSVLGTNPGFVDTQHRDFHLVSGSPCVDAGTSGLKYTDDQGASKSGVPVQQVDQPLHLSPRRDLKQPDIGALTTPHPKR
jgi:hypothetical protein